MCLIFYFLPFLLDFPGFEVDSGVTVYSTITITMLTCCKHVCVVLRNIIYPVIKPRGLFYIYFIKISFWYLGSYIINLNMIKSQHTSLNWKGTSTSTIPFLAFMKKYTCFCFARRKNDVYYPPVIHICFCSMFTKCIFLFFSDN